MATAAVTAGGCSNLGGAVVASTSWNGSGLFAAGSGSREETVADCSAGFSLEPAVQRAAGPFLQGLKARMKSRPLRGDRTSRHRLHIVATDALRAGLEP